MLGRLPWDKNTMKDWGAVPYSQVFVISRQALVSTTCQHHAVQPGAQDLDTQINGQPHTGLLLCRCLCRHAQAWWSTPDGVAKVRPYHPRDLCFPREDTGFWSKQRSREGFCLLFQ